MGFLDFLGMFFKRVIFFVVGFIVAFPLAGSIAYIGSTSKPYSMPEINPVFGFIGIIIFLIGIAMIIYAFKLKD